MCQVDGHEINMIAIFTDVADTIQSQTNIRNWANLRRINCEQEYYYGIAEIS